MAMADAVFSKPFTQQEPLPDDVITRTVEIMKGGRLHRYNTVGGEVSEAANLEAEYASFQGASHCLAVTSGGQALQIALRASGLQPGDKILANAYTLAPVPGAMHGAGAVPVFVEIDKYWHIDLNDLEAKAETSGARFLMLSHMRGHIADMTRIMEICEKHGLILIEDCAHTMGAKWNGIMSGNFGHVACFSTQTYKHINSGEGGLLTTNDPVIAARATVMSGSYMLYSSHGAGPEDDVFEGVRLISPNFSARLDNVRAAMIRGQLPLLNAKISEWNVRYNLLASAFGNIPGLRVPKRSKREEFVGSSIQFQATALGAEGIPSFITACGQRGVELKWFGSEMPHGFTSRYDSWKYLGPQPELKQTKNVLSVTCDMRIPLTFTLEDCQVIAEIVASEMERLQATD